jgi:hypothetical protein
LLVPSFFNLWLILAWGMMVVSLFIYPLFGLTLERAAWWAYLAIISGPVFMLWRTWLNLKARLPGKSIIWVRTPHGDTGKVGK